MYDTSDRAVTSYIDLPIADHSFGLSVHVIRSLPLTQYILAILLDNMESNENTNSCYVRQSLKCSFVVNVYLSIIYGLITKATI